MSGSARQLSNYKQSNKNTHSTATLNTGAPIGVKTAVQTVGQRGPILLQDASYIEEISHFDRERIPERVVHAKGAGAFGYFEVTHDITKYCAATIFEKVGKRTPLAVRFSTVSGELGSADTVRNPRGFAIKFYTDDGVWDLVGNNTPIFFIRDPIFFPSFIHTQKRNPQTNLKDASMSWDFATLRPETVHQLMVLYGDRGIPDGYRYMNGYGSHTFKTVNAGGEAFYVKFHYRTAQGVKNLDVKCADELAASDPDYATRDLFDAIARGDFPAWEFCIQLMTFAQAEQFRWNPFDVTKVWPRKDFPLMPVGRIVLNRNPENFFAEVEQIAFCPAHMVPGIEPSPDKMLQGRLFSYVDTQRHRLGPNLLQLPVNCPHVRVRNYQRDGAMAMDNQGAAPNYYPNSFGGPEPSQRVVDLQQPYALSGNVYRYDSGDEDNFSQPAVFWTKVLDECARKRMVANIAGNLASVEQFIQERAIGVFSQVSPDFGDMLREALKLKKIAKM